MRTPHLIATTGRIAATLLLVTLFVGCAAPASRALTPAMTAQSEPPTRPADPPTVPPAPTPVPATGLANPSFAPMGTVASDDLSQDGHSWSQADPILIDRYGHLIVPLQQYNDVDKRNLFVFSNDGGASWIDNTAADPESFIERGAAAYDSANDVIHVLWIGQSSTEGVFYRRYTPVRDAESRITGIERTPDVSLPLDREDADPMGYQHPLLLHVAEEGLGTYGGVLAIWGARGYGEQSGNEIRASLCVMGESPIACGAAEAWKAPAAPDTTTIGGQPLVAYSALLSNRTADISYPSALRKSAGTNAGDVYLFYHNGGAFDEGAWAFRRMVWSAESADWSAGLSEPQTIAPQQRAGSDAGYSLKQQLGSKPVEDPLGDRVYFAFASWKGDAEGDTWSFVAVDAAAGDLPSPIVDVYSAGGPHSYAPTGDISFDAVSGRLLVSYITTGEHRAELRLYDGVEPAGEPLTLFDEAPVDIPLLASQPRYGEPARLLVLLRDTVDTPNPPYRAWFGGLTWR